MRRCFDLAKRGAGLVSPNPLVGAVAVRDGKIIAEGLHARHGDPHAEAHLFLNAKVDLAGATLYVNLEPCCHTKKLTPPCAPQIIEKKIAHVVIANLDPNPQVSGGGVKMLEAAGIKVTTGVLKDEGERLNEIFFHRMRTGLPFIHLKSAATLDGKTALPSGESKWITSDFSRQDSHYGRRLYDAIVVGAQTIRSDNPQLNVRLKGEVIEKQPYRLIFTKSGKLPREAQVFTDENRHRTIIVTDLHTTIDALPPQQVIRLETLEPFPFEKFNEQLFERGIYSLWLEGGADLHSLFLQYKKVNRMTLYLAPKIMGEGKAMFTHSEDSLQNLLTLEGMDIQLLGSDLKVTGLV
ncbi:MAG: bifunctional diaminohydroxyphosphoribosylaminopyrimidine deaminase/5-amino-6-(5-phosphoribosylamino)uracil reductase RibD [Bacteriovoracaceae bacterium]|nr:bifunctional diaminohydroxyphosphoribosylaminopyrimidine deaminase/5-amino-6-(5-phosphoribosylamino)uracil reductase RibD [Bacteriovoracaceae bacterium]